MYLWRCPALGISTWEHVPPHEKGLQEAIRRAVQNIDSRTGGRVALGLIKPVVYVKAGTVVSRFGVTGSMKPRYHVTLLGEDASSEGRPVAAVIAEARARFEKGGA